MKSYKTGKIEKSDIMDTKKFEIPKYQRNLVWSKTKKEELIDSIIHGFPIGTLLIAENEGRWRIIDGLQRITTLKDYYANPFSYYKKHARLLTLFDEYEIELNDKERYLECIKPNFMLNNENTNLIMIYADIEKIFNKYKNHIDFLNKLEGIQKDFLRIMDDISIPMINYLGSNDNLPLIFERLNSKGVALSKFDIYAATWSNQNIKLKHKDIEKFIKDRYINMYSDSNIDVDFDDKEFKPNIFDFGYGLGIFLENKYPNLFKRTKGWQVPSHGFNLLSLNEFNSVSRIKELDKKLIKKSEEEILTIIEKIDRIAKIIDEALKNTSFNYLTQTPLVAHTEYQLYSLFGYVLNAGNKLDKNKFKIYAWKKVYIDLIRNYWSGSGDSKVAKIIDGNNKYYESDIDYELSKQVINQYLKEENEQNNKGNISVLDRLTISILYRHSSVYDSEKGMDIEHIVPINRFNDSESFPIGSVVNMTFLMKFDNRSKKDKTYWEEKSILKYKSDIISFKDTDIVKKYYYPTIGDLNFVASNNVTTERYNSFLKLRAKLLSKKIEDFLKK